MRIKSFILFSTITLSCMPLLSYAHISLTVSNNTEKPATAYIGTKFCSGDYGAMGIIEKHTKKAISS